MNRTEFEIFACDSRTALLRTAQQIVGSGDEAEDVVQEAMINNIRSYSKHTGTKNHTRATW